MDEKINAELQKLQDELVALDSAVKQIEKAGQISTDVINAVKAVEAKYAEHLDQILSQYSEYLNSSYRHVETNINDLLLSHKAQVEEITQTLVKFQKSEEAQTQTFNTTLAQAKAATERQVTDITAAMNSQLKDVNKMLNNYLDLAQAAARLYDKVDSVDFPARFTKTEVMIGSTYNEINAIKVHLQNITEINESQSKMIRVQNRKFNIVLTLLFIFSLMGAAAFIIFKYYPYLFAKG